MGEKSVEKYVILFCNGDGFQRERLGGQTSVNRAFSAAYADKPIHIIHQKSPKADTIPQIVFYVAGCPHSEG